jgi:AcrR family transcriptional regulator
LPSSEKNRRAFRTRRNSRRDRLLEAAARRFLRHGFDNAALRDIAADVGMQAGSIYHHFSSKADLLVAVHEEGLRRITTAVGAALAKRSGDPWRRLEAACVAHLSVLLEGGDFFSAVMREMPRGSERDRRRVARMRDAYEAIFARLIRDLPLAAGTDRHNLRLMLFGAMNWSHRWYRPGAEAPGEIARKFVSNLRTRLDAG